MNKNILAISLSFFATNVFANNYYNIIYSNDINYEIDTAPSPSSPIIEIVNDLDNDGILSIAEIKDLDNLEVKVKLPSSNVFEDYILNVSGQDKKVLSQSDIDNGEFSYFYDIPNYGESISLKSFIEGVRGKKSPETFDSATTQLYVDTNTLTGVTYNNTHTLLDSKGLLTNFSYEAWVKPHQTIKTGSVQGNLGVDGTSGENYIFYPDHGGTNSGKHGLGLSVGTNGYKVHVHSTAYMPAVFVKYTPVSSQEWTHFFIVVNNNIPSIYVNGQYVGSGLAPSSGAVYSTGSIGDQGSYGKLKGDVALVRIWNNSLTSSDVSNIYNKYLQFNSVIGSAKLIELKNN